MRQLRLEKPGIRGLGVAESFSPEAARSVLAGVIMRNDGMVDGFVFGSSAISGDDATDAILGMYRAANRSDIRYLLVWGTVISRYNMVDVGRIARITGIPVIGLSGEAAGDLAGSIRRRFPDRAEAYRALGERSRVELRTGHAVYARMSGCTAREAARLLDATTAQGKIPEPIRLARMLASAARRYA